MKIILFYHGDNDLRIELQKIVDDYVYLYVSEIRTPFLSLLNFGLGGEEENESKSITEELGIREGMVKKPRNVIYWMIGVVILISIILFFANYYYEKNKRLKEDIIKKKVSKKVKKNVKRKTSKK